MSHGGQAAELLGSQGVFTGDRGFAVRAGQQRLAGEIEQALKQGDTVVAEAATGIGKTWAYLVPALISGKRVVISTATKNLQEQLFERDLPRVQEALDTHAKTALLKGRANYLCRYRLQRAREEGSGSAVLEDLHAWASRSRTGDRSEAHWLGEDDVTWPQVTSTRDNCLGRECPYFDDCFVYRARQRAAEADVVVVNHDLLFASLALKREGIEDFLPGAEAYILDEAHKTPAIAAGHFGISLASGQFRALCDDTRAEAAKESGLLNTVLEPTENLQTATRKLAAALAEHEPRGHWPLQPPSAEIDEQLAALKTAIGELADALEVLEGAGSGLDHCAERARALSALLDEMDALESDWVHWYQLQRRGFQLNRTPLQLAGPFSELTTSNAAWIYTSATLAVGERFDHFTGQLGLQDATTLQVPSEFDYAHNALLYLPQGLSAPRAAGYDISALVAVTVPVINAANGGAFVLFTSRRALREATPLYKQVLDLPVFVQGEAPRTRLLEEFREAGNGVLLGTKSFWEGVDVAGSALSLVIIDRLPFESPNDPVFQMRQKVMAEEGLNAFMHWSLPEAVLTLKQGAGRLIRHANDRGVLMLCDPRIQNKPYGRIFLDSLPPMPVTTSIEDVRAFFDDASRG